VSGIRRIFVVPIEPVEIDIYADLPIYERIQMLLLELNQAFLLQL
jgi:hypothetical protein